MLKKGAGSSHLSQNNKNINIDLQLNLLNTWTKFNVADYYQNIFLVHLDEIAPSQAEQAIKKEIAQTLEKKSPYFQLLKLEKERNSIILKLQQLLQEGQQHQNQPLLNQICLQIKQLREVNLIAAEHILKMENIYHCNNEQSAEKQMEYYDSMLNNLDRDNQFLKESLLTRHLQFDQGYDPFLMNDYERIHRSKDESINPSIKELFDINISYAYRLMKTKSLILQVRALANRVQPVTINNIKLPSSDRLKQNGTNFQRKKPYSNKDISRTQSFFEDTKMPARKSIPLKLDPLPLYPSKHVKSRTTIYRDRPRDQRPETYSITEPNQKFERKQNRQLYPPSRAQLSFQDIKPQKRQSNYPKIYYQFQPQRSLDFSRKSKYLRPFEEDSDNYIPLTQKHQKQIVKPYKYKAAVGQIYKSIKMDPAKMRSQQSNKVKLRTQPQENRYTQKFNPYIQDIYSLSRNNQKPKPFAKKFTRFQQPSVVKPIQDQQEEVNNQPLVYLPKQRQIINYNPVKKQEYDTQQAVPKQSKYDFTPPKRDNQSPKFINEMNSQSEESENGLNYQDPLSKYNLPRKKNNKKKSSPKSDQESQTIQARKDQNKKPQVQQNTKKPKVLNTDSDQTLQDEDIIDDRVSRPSGPPIRSLRKQENLKNDQTKEIKMKIGKATLEEVTQLLKKYKIKNEYSNSFDLQKTIAWIKVNQTYLTQFTLNNQTAIIALCSPIPSIGTALKFWAAVNDEIDFSVSCNLFNKYMDFIQKNVASSKILFGGKPFRELQYGSFIIKRQNLYQRTRKTAAPAFKSQFQPFLYIQCSNLKFTNKTQNKKLYSSDIEQFTKQNSFSASFISQVSNSSIPSAIKPLIKYDSNLQNFKEVNQILSKEEFDTYEASQIQASNIELMRLYLNTPLLSSFIAQDSCFKFNGTLLHQKDRECVVSVALKENNGVIYFAKNISFSSMLQITKKNSTNRVYFTAPMFNKKLYGKMPETEGDNYGNWQINLTWQDELQGRIKHNMKQSITFSSENFKVLIELQKVLVLGFQVNKQDLI